ncbi:hypothetical protein NIES22_53610 [Calothrix brevissima NIES-22]|nr:hypothetical protein NIES22_53610 [Calothrix brevissima NIES-22]
MELTKNKLPKFCSARILLAFEHQRASRSHYKLIGYLKNWMFLCVLLQSNLVNEVRKFFNEVHKLINEAQKLVNEVQKLVNEARKFFNEVQKLVNEAQKFFNEVQKLVNEARKFFNEVQKLVNEAQKLVKQSKGELIVAINAIAYQSALYFNEPPSAPSAPRKISRKSLVYAVHIESIPHVRKSPHPKRILLVN